MVLGRFDDSRPLPDDSPGVQRILEELGPLVPLHCCEYVLSHCPELPGPGQITYPIPVSGSRCGLEPGSLKGLCVDLAGASLSMPRQCLRGTQSADTEPCTRYSSRR
jgi:hypothetical protein